MFARCRAVLVLVSLFTSAACGDQNTPTLYAEWREATKVRLSHIFPRPGGPRANRTDVFLVELARVLEVSVARASVLLTGPQRHLSYKHADKIAAYAGLSSEYVLAADILDRYGTVAALEQALAGEPAHIVHFFVKMYARRLYERDPRPTDPSLVPSAIFLRWRAMVRTRLIKLMPGRGAKTLAIPILARNLDVTQATARGLSSFDPPLNFEQAERLGTRYGVAASWILATDVLAEFKSLADVERALDGEAKVVRTLLLGLYVDHVMKCTDELALP